MGEEDIHISAWDLKKKEYWVCSFGLKAEIHWSLKRRGETRWPLKPKERSTGRSSEEERSAGRSSKGEGISGHSSRRSPSWSLKRRGETRWSLKQTYQLLLCVLRTSHYFTERVPATEERYVRTLSDCIPTTHNRRRRRIKI